MNTATNERFAIEGENSVSHDKYFATDHLVKDLHGRSFRGGLVALAGQGGRFLLQTVSTVCLARLLLPQDFGLIAMVGAIVGIVGMTKDLGLAQATVQRAKITHAQISTLFWLNCVLSLAATLVVAALAPAIAWFYGEPRLVGITAALSVNFLLGGLNVQHAALLRRQMQFNVLAITDTISVACGIAAGILMAWLGCKYWSLVGLSTVANIVNLVLVWWKCDWRPGVFKRSVGARTMLSFGGKLTGFTLLNYVTRNFDNIIVGRVLGAAAIGVYTKAYGLLMLPMVQINAPVSGAVLPALSRLQSDPKRYAKLYLNALGGVSLVTVPLVVFSSFLARDVVLLMLGPKWLPVAPVFQLLAPAAVVSAVNFAPGWLCVSRGQTQLQLRYGIIAAPTCLIAFLIGVQWGIEGVATSCSIVFTLLYWAFVWYATRGSPVRNVEVVRSFLRAFLPACAAGLIAWIARNRLGPGTRPILALTICAVVFSVVYLAGIVISARNRSMLVAAFSALTKSPIFLRKRHVAL